MFLQFFVEKEKENLTNSTLQTQSLKKVIHKKFLKINERGVGSNQTMMSGKLLVKNLNVTVRPKNKSKGRKKGELINERTVIPYKQKKATVFFSL